MKLWPARSPGIHAGRLSKARHKTRPSGQVNLWSAMSSDIRPGRLSKGKDRTRSSGLMMLWPARSPGIHVGWLRKGKHKTRALGQVNRWPARSSDICPGRLSKASVVHIVPSDLMTSIVQQRSSLGSCATSPSYSQIPSIQWPWVKSCQVGGTDKY